MLRVGAYTRVSTRKFEQGESLDNQITYFTQLINDNPEWVFAGIYADKDSGGSVIKRKDFQRMISDCEKGKIDLIITKNCKRFARNVVECLEIIRKLKRLKVGVYFEHENINTLETSEEFFITMAEITAEQELESHSKNVKLGIKFLFERGQSLQSIRVLGYEREGIRGLKIVQDEAELVRRIFALYVSGIGSDTIARTLNNEGLKTIEGLPYKGFTIRYILENEKYVGNCLLQKVYKKNYKDYINNGEYEQYLAENTHPAIIDKETWDLAQAIRATRAEKSKNKKEFSNPFKKYVFCSNCGLAYQLYVNNNNTDAKTYALKCYGRVKNGVHFCHNKPIRLNTMKALFVKMHNELIGSKNVVVHPPITNESILAIQAEMKCLMEKERLYRQMEVNGLLNEDASLEYQRIIERLKWLEEEKNKQLIQETSNLSQHKKSKELERYCQTAVPLLHFDEAIFKAIVEQIKVITREKVQFILINGQQIELRYQVGKYKNDDIIEGE